MSALRVSLSVAGPSVALLILGHPELTLYALIGALTGMYGRTEPHQLRLGHQLGAAGMLVTGVAVGTGLSINGLHSWWLVGIETLLAGLGSVVADRLNFRPSGPFFGLLALGACASVPVTAPWSTAVLIAVGSAAFAIAIGFAGWMRRRVWHPRPIRNAPSLGGLRKQSAGVQAGRYVLAVGAAGAAGVLSGSAYPHWAMAAAAVPLAAADLAGGIYRGIHRVVGTFLGLGIVAVLLLPAPWQLNAPQDAPALVLVVILLQFTTELFMTRHYGLAMVSFTPVIVLATQLAAPADPYALISERAIETVVGATIGVIILVASRRGGPATSVIHSLKF